MNRTEQCCNCSSPGAAVVVDGGWRKPVCVDHARLYVKWGYVVEDAAE